ncbi:MAG: S41 family peptidase [Chloroflexi bacterium]|nr:S41 family peptidase [Chloroflexota bacterium]
MLKSLKRWSPLFIGAIMVFVVACGGGGDDNAATAVVDDELPGRDRLIASATPLPVIDSPKDIPEGLDPVWETFAAIAREYVERENIDPEALARGAIRGMLDALDDPYTAYVTPTGFERQLESFQGDFEGIGAQIDNTPDGQRIIVVAPIPDTPAERAGIKSGDIIIAVDGEDTEGWSVIDAVNRIRGKGGTPVDLTIQRLGELDPIVVTIVRGTIPTASVFRRDLHDGDDNPADPPYSVIRITQFTERTPEELRDVIEDVKEAGSEGIILDVRSNPGGLLDSTVDVAAEFLSGGLVTYEINGRGVRRDWPAHTKGTALDIPLVVLVDQFSASGSEVLAAALQDRGRAAIIGEQTFGKGSVNILRELREDEGGIYLTIGRWYTPNGGLIEGDGVIPDVTVELPFDAEVDLQLDAAIEQLNFQLSIVQAS